MVQRRFLRVDSHKYSKLGVRRKKKQKYRRPSGGDNKIRLNRAGRLRKVKIGFKNEKSKRGLINNMRPVEIYNLGDLKNIKDKMIGIVGKIGIKKKKEILEYALNNKIILANLNIEKYLKNIDDKIRRAKELKKVKLEKKKIRDKKVIEKEIKEKNKSQIKEKTNEDTSNVTKDNQKQVENKEKGDEQKVPNIKNNLQDTNKLEDKE